MAGMYLHLDIRIRAEKNLQYYERILNSTGTHKMINPRVCGHLCCCTNTEKVRETEWIENILFSSICVLQCYVMNLNVWSGGGHRVLQ